MGASAPHEEHIKSTTQHRTRDRQEKALRKLLFGMVNVAPLGAVDDLLILFEGILAHPSATRGASVADLLSDFATVLDANGDYYRKPQLAAWLQRVSTDLVATAPKL